MFSHDQLQSYLRHSAAQGREVIAAPPFTCYFDPGTDFSFFNYAIPDAPVGGNLEQPLATLRGIFHAHDRTPRFEFIQEYTPDLAQALHAAGFKQEGSYPLLLCTPETLIIPSVPSLEIRRLTPESSLDEARVFSVVQGQGFDPYNVPQPSDADLERLLQGLAHYGAFLAYLDGEPVAAGNFSAPHDGLTELTGIATLTAFRRRGIGSALTAHMTQAAFEQGVSAAFLTAGDEQAGRVYTRVGFQPHATALAFSVGHLVTSSSGQEVS
jgi:ribosomal protein S18 acetylase RimI-like enzyme